jgi:patatin-like phospholipase/acyl hydrolase
VTASPPASPTFKILSLDGGGVRGAFIAAFLAKIQENLPCPLIQYFDLMAGTSTGGLIAVALALKVSAEDVREFYRDHARAVFKRRPPKLFGLMRFAIDALTKHFAPGIDAEWLFHSKFDAAPLQEELRKRLGDRRLGEAKCRLVIPAVDLTAAKVVVFKTPHRPGFIRDRHYLARDVVLATTAAPSYFPHATIKPGSAYSDGGLWANNPAIVGYVEAVKIAQECTRAGSDRPFTAADVQMLSIGTGRRSYFAKPNADDTGLKWWAPRLLNVMGEAQSEGIHQQMLYILGDRYTRIDFDIPDGEWGLDSLDIVDELMHFGEQKAVENFPSLRAKHFHQANAHYVPFE